MGEFELTTAAEADLERLYDFGVARFGVTQARRYQEELFGCFQLLADFPGIAGLPFKVKRRDVYRFPFGSHVVVFTASPAGIVIGRVFHEAMDWRKLLMRRGL